MGMLLIRPTLWPEVQDNTAGFAFSGYVVWPSLSSRVMLAKLVLSFLLQAVQWISCSSSSKGCSGVSHEMEDAGARLNPPSYWIELEMTKFGRK